MMMMMMTVVCALKYSVPLCIRKDFKIFTCCVMSSSRAYSYVRACSGRTLLKMPFVVEERGKENIVPVRLLGRERLACISVACVIGNYFQNFYTLPSRRIDSKELSSIYIRWHSLRSSIPGRGCMIPLSNLRGSRMALADTIIVCSLPLAKHSPTSIRWQGVRKTVRYAGFFSRLKSIWDWFYCPLYRVAGCPFWRGGYERMELYDKTIGTCEFVRYNAVSVVEGVR